jgi:tetratricopeptide (TPR) repeat protein
MDMAGSRALRLLRWAALLGLVVLVAGLGVGPARAEKYALLVGVRQYTGQGLHALSWTEADMVDLADALKGCGYRPENIVLMTQRVGAARGQRYQPVSGNIRRELRLLLRDRKPGDTVLVAFSGHGLQLTASNRFYFCPADTTLSNVRTLVSLQEVYRELERCPASLKIMMADACRNDPFEAAKSRAVGSVPRPTAPQPQAVPAPTGVAAFFACSKGQEAYEYNSLKNGVFFHFVIEGLRGAAAVPGTREVTLPSLRAYVVRKVRAYVRRTEHKEQTPELLNRTRGLVSLVGGPDEQRRPAAAVVGLLARGQALARRGETDKALALFEQALKLDGNNAEAHACRADALNDKGKYDQALADCAAALRLNPRLAAAHEFQADAFIARRDFTRAIEACDAALALDPKRAGAYNDRGVVYALQKKPRQAVAELTKALALDPKNGRAYGNRASAYLELHEYARAVRDYTEALRLGPPDGSAYYYRGVARAKLGQTELARTDQTRARKLGFSPPRE